MLDTSPFFPENILLKSNSTASSIEGPASINTLPDAYFITFELVVYALFGLCLVHAWRRGLAVVWQLVAGALFGLLLEWATIQQLHAYEYGRFLLMLGEVPVGIGVGWGTIIYAARQFSDSTSLPGWARPVLDALLALNIDLSMDTIAIRLGFWEWPISLDQQFFGVPFGNFWAWFWVVFSFSGGLRLLLRWQKPSARWLAPPGAVAIGVASVLITNWLIVQLFPYYPLDRAVIGLVFSAALLLVWSLHPRLVSAPPPLAAWVPAGFHIYFLAAGILSGVIFQPPALLVVSLAMALIAAWMHRNGRLAIQAETA